MAMNPQITKSCAVDDLALMHRLIFLCSRFSFFLLYFLSLPIMLETETILKLWLGTVPDHTVPFVRLMLAVCLINAVSRPLVTAVHATGKIRTFQAVEGSILLLILPLSWIFLKKGFPPEAVFAVHLAVEIMTQCVRTLIVCPMIGLSKRAYCKNVPVRCAPVLLLSPAIPLLAKRLLAASPFPGFFAVAFCGCTSVAVWSWLFGMNGSERKMIINRCRAIAGGWFRQPCR
jgi:hypothetical protein